MRKEALFLRMMLCLGILSVGFLFTDRVSASEGPNTIVFPDGAVFPLESAEVCPSFIQYGTVVRCHSLPGTVSDIPIGDVLATHNKYLSPLGTKISDYDDLGVRFLAIAGTGECFLLGEESLAVGPATEEELLHAWVETKEPRIIISATKRSNPSVHSGRVYVMPILGNCANSDLIPTTVVAKQSTSPICRFDKIE